jgi:hypothetical protein
LSKNPLIPTADLGRLCFTEMVLYVALIAILNLALGYALAVYLHPGIARGRDKDFASEPAYDSGDRYGSGDSYNRGD